MTIPNAPPVEVHAMNVEDLYAEAKNFLDGEPITTSDQAEGVAKLLSQIRQARNAADEQRKAEKKPHDDAAKAVQIAYAPLLAKCDLAAGACKDALTPYQTALEAGQRVIADKAREEAETLRIAALSAAQAAAQSGGLSERETADNALKASERASKDAAKMDRATPKIAGGDRAIGLRTSYRAEITDHTLFARWAWTHRRSDYEAFLSDLAEREGRRGPIEIPGLTVHTIRNSA